MIPLIAIRLAPYAIAVAAVAFAVYRIRASATEAANTRHALADATARIDGLALAAETLRGHYERAAAASAQHRRTVNTLRASLNADQAALSRMSDACLDARLPADAVGLLSDATGAIGAKPAADAGAAATVAGD